MLHFIARIALIYMLFQAGFLPAPQPGRPVVRDAQILTPQVARFDRFELKFNLDTAATHLNLPYDPQPPPGLENVSGVSADALFISPTRKSYTQPAFYYQPYTLTQHAGHDHRLPADPAYWLVRFTPQEEGQWQVRLRATDRNGMSLYPQDQALTFRVTGASQVTSRQHGFLRVSPTDPRYFEFQDGAPFIGVGFNTGMGDFEATRARFASFEQNRVNFTRTWLSGEGINGSQWSPWASFHLPFDGYIPGVSLETRDVYPGRDLAFRLDEKNPCLFQGWTQGPVAVEPGVAYTLTARVKLVNVSGQGSGAGFVVKTGGWLEKSCARSGNGALITAPVSGTRDWFEVGGSFTAGGYFLNNLYLALQDASGAALVDEVRLYRRDDPARTNLLRQPTADSHLYFDPLGAARWDDLIELAGQHGVYLKLVIDEKNEWIRNRIGPDGKFMDQADNNNFYAAPGTKVRWLEQAWWRYIIARWGYSPAIHSFEYVNEGDPYNGNHYEAANAMAAYIHRFDPSRHMVTTSFWHSYPGPEFWANSKYAEIDYADIHAYISTGWSRQNAGFLGDLKLDERPGSGYRDRPAVLLDTAAGSRFDITPRGLALREKGEWILRYWMKADRLQSDCANHSTGAMLRLRWMLDGGLHNGGREGVAPANSQGKDFLCASPAGSFDWRQMRSDQDRDGRLLPEPLRLVIADDRPHAFSLSIENYGVRSGQAWISAIELVSPSGKVVPVIGSFDTTSFKDDTAWYNAAYGLLLGGGSPVGAGKPLVRGESGIDEPDTGGWDPAINQDKQGIWLHNNLWAQVGPGGIIDLPWWASETILENASTGRVPSLLPLYAAYRNFMDGTPLSNGRYRDAQAQPSDPRLRAWGQRDDTARRAHLWIQNRAHTWRAVIDGQPIPALSGAVTLPDFPPGAYHIEWWDTYKTQNQVIQTEQITHPGGPLTLPLPHPLQTDLALKISPES